MMLEFRVDAVGGYIYMNRIEFGLDPRIQELDNGCIGSEL